MAAETPPSIWNPSLVADARHSLTQWARVVAGLARSAVGVEEALEWTLALICEHTGWPLGHIFLRDGDSDSDAMVSSPIWADSDPLRHQPFVEASAGLVIPTGHTLPGLIVDLGDAVWLDDLSVQGDLVRAEAAARSGLVAATGYPIIGSRRIEGVMEFFLHEPAAPEAGLDSVIFLIGAHLGGVIDRCRSESALAQSERRLRDLIEHAPDAVFAVDLHGRIQVVNAEAEHLSGYSREELLGTSIDVLVPDTVRPWHHSLRHRYSAEPRMRPMLAGGDLTLRRRDGGLTPVDISLSPIDRAGSGLVVAVVRDLTERRRADEAVRRSEDRLKDQQRTLERIARGERLEQILRTVCADVEKQFPGAYCSVLLIDDEERCLRHAAAPSLPPEFVRRLDGLPVARGLGACGTAAAVGEAVIVEDMLSDPLTKAFTDLACSFDLGSVWSLPLKSSSGAVVGTMALYRQGRHRPESAEQAALAATGNLAALAIERYLSERALARAAQVDPLTQLPNRARFLEEVQVRLGSGRDDVTVMFLDLDRFKWINDSLGHPTGDRILVEASRRLRAVVSGRNMVARFGGDEFTVMLLNASRTRTLATAARIEQAFAEPFELDGGEFFLTVSIGIASGGEDASAMIRDADAAMYEAKDRGRDRHVWFDDRLRGRAAERLRIETSLRRAIERAEFIVHYQPVLDLSTGRWAGVEALARWQPPDGELVGPDRFIPLAEETGLILPLGSRIMHAALSDAEALGMVRRGLTMSVNISALQLSDPSLAREVDGLLASYGLPASHLVLELTESALMEDYDSALAALREMASQGVKVVIDDFGTGYSSISRLNELPVAGIKIDRSFTAGIGRDDNAESVLRAIVDLAHALGLEVVAEGVESASALELLRAIGCDLAQGYHLARPLPRPDAGAVLERPPSA